MDYNDIRELVYLLNYTAPTGMHFICDNETDMYIVRCEVKWGKHVSGGAVAYNKNQLQHAIAPLPIVTNRLAELVNKAQKQLIEFKKDPHAWEL